jgi:uncharacterized protein (TIGR03067 family)
VVLCCLHGLSYDEAAAQLNWKPGTLSGRLSRAKAILRDRLTARGIAPPAAVFAAFLAGLSESTAAPHAVIRTLTTTALGEPGSGRAGAVAAGVTRMMTIQALARKTLAGTAALVLLAGGLTAAGVFASDPPKQTQANPDRQGGGAKKETDLDRMRDDWVFESAEAIGGANGIHQGWKSVVTFAGEYVTVSKYLGLEYSTRYTIDETKSPKHFDMTLPEAAKQVLKFQDGTIKGIYRVDGDTLEMCLAGAPDAPRPAEFTTGPGLNQFRFTLKRKKKGFHPDDEQDLTVRVVDADGKPVDGAVVCHTTMYGQTNPDGERLGWTYYPGYPKPLRTDKTGTLTLAADDRRGLLGGLLYARHEGRKLAALEPLSPARIMAGVTITLKPEAKLSGRVVVPGGGDPGPTQVYLCTATTIYAAGYVSPKGEFEFVVPPGDYRLLARGDYLLEEAAPGMTHYPSLANTVPVTVGKEGKEVTLEAKASKLGALRGKPAPDLGEMVAWKNGPVTPADLKGKVVLVHLFHTGNQSGIVREMPRLIDLHKTDAAGAGGDRCHRGPGRRPGGGGEEAGRPAERTGQPQLVRPGREVPDRAAGQERRGEPLRRGARAGPDRPQGERGRPVPGEFGRGPGATGRVAEGEVIWSPRPGGVRVAAAPPAGPQRLTRCPPRSGRTRRAVRPGHSGSAARCRTPRPRRAAARTATRRRSSRTRTPAGGRRPAAR